MTTIDLARLGPDAGTLTEVVGGWELSFERSLRHSPERVWKALTTPEGLACWLAEAQIHLAPGGHMNLNFRQPDHEFMPDTPEKRRQANKIVTVQPYTLFEHTFGDPTSIVSWRLRPDGDGTHLSLRHHIPAAWRDARQKVLSGWHYHMQGLEGAVDGVAMRWIWDEWFALRDAYAATLDQDA